MKKHLGIIPLVVLLFVTRTAVAQDHQRKWAKEPKAFRGVPFTATFDQAKLILEQPNQCTTSVSGPVDECPTNTGGEVSSDGHWVEFVENPTLSSDLLLDDTTRVSTTFLFGNSGKKLEEIDLTFSHDDWRKVKAAFILKYGQPVVIHKTLKNLMGATITGEQLSWSGSKVWLTLEEYNNDFDSSSGIMSTLSNLRKKSEEERKKIKDATSRF